MKIKLKPSIKSMQASQLFIDTLKNHPFLVERVFTVQKKLNDFKYLSLYDQIADIQANLDLLQDRPLMAVQTHRLGKMTANAVEVDFAELQKKFQSLWEDEIQVSSPSRLKIDPKSQTEHIFSSEILRYKQYVLDILFMYLCFQDKSLATIPQQIEKYVQYLNQVCEGFTISKVTIREQPYVDSQTLIELPKHTALEFYAEKVNQHWYKVIFNLDANAISGYVVGAYIKAS